jgi:hypothetical protein
MTRLRRLDKSTHSALDSPPRHRDEEGLWLTPGKICSRILNLIRLLTMQRFEYVKDFEQPDVLLPNTWIVVRIDGRGFHK